jgi:hypothetical protein
VAALASPAVDDDECIHGLQPATCSLCRAKAAPKPVRPVPSTRPSSRPAISRHSSTRPAANRPGAKGAPVHLAGRKEYFGAGQRGVWWIDQTGRADEEWAEGVVTAARPASGSVPASARNVGEMRTGDLTIHVVSGELVAVGIATGDGRATSGPPTGWLAEVAVVPLVTPIEVAELPPPLRPGPPHPFTNQGFVQPGTCYPFPPDVAARLARRFADRFPPGHPFLPG